ncbi:flavin reductase [Thalassobacillus devorans]|uniref:Flavin reductase n=1 Tax=Thalassobacillus devorans TaxID=279813 RepID=A0ABQ1NIJ1_9BACI|nr:flavin reductase family protein [Thalassobacillus devorans]NIK27201.1 flavin reductase (DIM6/NTAB) family NADH-FMN oxidoreductase RutF [Thalassobacillus devorans]GGC75799.1 flavin reductase [Thalassobacillus devorans]
MDDRQFRNAMGKFATGVTVIATETDGQVHGMTANAFMSVSLDPKLIVISVKEDAKMLDRIKESNHFSVNVLSCEQQEESMIFAGQKQPEEEFQFDYLEGVPVVRNALVQLSCEVYNEHVEGDHTLFVGRVTEMELKDGDPLIFNCGKYRELKEMESVSN